MTTTLTLGDVLIHTLIFFGGAFALWLIGKFRSAFSDYWARRSTSSRRKRIASLEKTLVKYEADFADTRLFVGRLLNLTVAAIVSVVFSVLFIALPLLYSNLVLRYHSGDIELLEIICLLLVLIGFFIFSAATDALRLESDPEEYRARLCSRIDRLRELISDP
jgi:hypothetical protein